VRCCSGARRVCFGTPRRRNLHASQLGAAPVGADRHGAAGCNPDGHGLAARGGLETVFLAVDVAASNRLIV
jgi:hypothetical protein